MVLFHIRKLIRPLFSGKIERKLITFHRNATECSNGTIKPMPDQMPYGLALVVCAVVPGLFVGAAISKSVATFLEENELFIPEDDDDDDD